MNFMTLQRPTFEELERRRQLRDNLSPQRSTTLQRRESMLSRGINAIMRRQSFMSPSNQNHNNHRQANLRRNDSFFMHSALAKDTASDMPSLITDDNNLHTVVHTKNRPGRNLSRAKSFKYPERVSQIPPAELTRLRSKSQVRNDNVMQQEQVQQVGNSSSDDPVYTSGSGGSAVGSGKSMAFTARRTLPDPSRAGPGYFEDLGYGQAVQWLSREKFFQPPPRILPRPNTKPRVAETLINNPRDISEPPPSNTKRRLPLPDIFYYGDRWQEQESRSRSNHASSLETPEPPPGSSDMMPNNNNNNR